MKSLLLPLAAVAALSLTGCAAYVGDPYAGAYGYPGAYSYGYGPNVSIGVSGGYGYGGYGHERGWRDGDRGWRDGDRGAHDRGGDGRGWR